MGVAGAGGRTRAANQALAPGVDAAVGGEAGIGARVHDFRARADAVNGARALALVGQQRAFHPQGVVLGNAAGSAGGVDRERKGAWLGRVAMDPAGGGIELQAAGELAVGDREVEAIALDAQEQLRGHRLVHAEVHRGAGGLREIGLRQGGRLHREVVAARGGAGASGERGAP